MTEANDPNLKERLLAAEGLAAVADQQWLQEIRSGMQIQRQREQFWTRLAGGLWISTAASIGLAVLMALILPLAAAEVLIVLTAVFPVAGVFCFWGAVGSSVVCLMVRHTAGTSRLQAALVELTAEVRRLQDQQPADNTGR